MLIDKELPVSCSHVTDFFFNSIVTMHIKPTAPHHTTVLIASVKKNSTIRSFTHVISVRLSKNLAKDGTMARKGCFTLLPFLSSHDPTDKNAFGQFGWFSCVGSHIRFQKNLSP